MTEKKKTAKTTTNVANKAKAKSATTISKEEPKEEIVMKKESLFPAVEAANIIGLSSFDFYMIKKAKKINDGKFVSLPKMQEYYKEVIIEGR